MMMWRNRQICTRFQEKRHIFGRSNFFFDTWQRPIKPGMWHFVTNMWLPSFLVNFVPVTHSKPGLGSGNISARNHPEGDCGYHWFVWDREILSHICWDKLNQCHHRTVMTPCVCVCVGLFYDPIFGNPYGPRGSRASRRATERAKGTYTHDSIVGTPTMSNA